MRGKRFPFLVRQSLTTLAVAVTLISTAWAKPKFKILHAVPGGLWTGVTLDAKGNLYGVTGGGGDHNQGIIFQLTPGTRGWTLTTLHNFDGQNGGTPNGGLIFDGAGNFYGTALGGKSQQGGGVAYEMVRTSRGWEFTVLYEFCLQYHCPGSLTMDGMGNLYGNAGGGTYGEGVVYKLTPTSGEWDESVLYNFDGNKGGIGPSGPLIFDTAGDLYGTTAAGNIHQSGTVFRLKHTSGDEWQERALYEFKGQSHGAGPRYGVVFGRAGSLYGVAGGGSNLCGGGFSCGVVFRLTPTSTGRWKETVIYHFTNQAEGWSPSSGVIVDKAGSLYGTTSAGGIGPCFDGCGVVYKLAPLANGKWKYMVLHEFNSQAESPSDGGLVLDKKGNLYGVAYSVVYEITP